MGRCSPSPTPWVNWGRTQEVFPKRIVRPKSLPELQEIVRTVSKGGGRVKAVATGLSFSDILQTDDTLIEVTGLLGESDAGVLLPLEEDLWRDPNPPAPMVRIVCGAQIRQLNAALAQAGLAFTNLGGYDEQTMVGAISTSTHGSGVGLAPLPDSVRSLDLVKEDGTIHRIEPYSGITDRKKFDERYQGTRALVQNDDAFWSVVVSMGCMGIIYSVVMEVSRAYRLQERRQIRPWKEVRRAIEKEGALCNRHYEVLINPYRTSDNDYSCLVTERNVAHRDEPNAPRGSEFLEKLAFLDSSQAGIVGMMKSQPRLIPGILQFGMEVEATKNTVDEGFRIYNIGKINTADVVSGEYFFPLCVDYLCAVEKMLETAANNRRHNIYQTSPLSLRFVAGSNAYLSPAREVPHCTIEMSIFRGMSGAIDALGSYEQLCLDLGGRPHWGQLHMLTGKPGYLSDSFPKYDAWLAVYREYNKTGVFNNHFTDRLGLSMPMTM